MASSIHYLKRDNISLTVLKFYLLSFDFTLQEYIHRVGRTARGLEGKGHALLILRPQELGFLRFLKQARVPLNEFEFSWTKIADIQSQVGCDES